MNGNVQSPPLDLHDFRERNERIVKARDSARQDYERYGLEEADAEHEYRKRKAAALATYRGEDKGVTEAEIMAEGEVAGWRHKRDTAHVLRKSAELRIAELEANRAMLRAELSTSTDLERMGV